MDYETEGRDSAESNAELRGADLNSFNESPPSRGAQASGTTRGARRGQRGLKGCAIFMLGICFAVVVLPIMMMFALGILFGSMEGMIPKNGVSGGGRHNLVRGDADAGHTVAVIDIHGMISNSGERGVVGSQQIYKLMDKAMTAPDVIGVVVNINSPGGEVIASDEIYKVLSDARKNFEKPIVACMRSVCASGGYYVSLGADHVVANELTLTGSIGVIIPRFDYSDLLNETLKVKVKSVTSGDMKNMFSGGVERSEKEAEQVRQQIQHLVDSSFERFATLVADNRDGFTSLEQVLEAPFSDGRVVAGAEALEMGLVDQLGYFEDAMGWVVEQAGVSEWNVKAVRYAPPARLTDLLFAKLEADEAIKVETDLLPALSTARNPFQLYYMMPELSTKLDKSQF